MIELKDVHLQFGDRVILDHINLKVEDGETLVVLGGSGAGKSTILRIMIGLLKPNSGQVLIDGQDIAGMSEDELNVVRRKMGMVFQYSALFDSLTVGENVAFGLREHTDMSDEEMAAIVKEKLALVDLEGTENYMPNELSGGMKKRVSLARATAVNPGLILYDEPTSGLDPITSGTISRLIRRTQEHLKCISVVVTHDMQSAFYIGDRIALLDQGKFVEVSPMEEFRHSENIKVQQFIHGVVNEEEMRKILNKEKRGNRYYVENRD